VDLLDKRDWNGAAELTAILEQADKEIEQIVDKAISDVLAKLQGSYLEEAQTWADNQMTNANGDPIRIRRDEQRKAQTEVNRIRRTINKLQSLIMEAI
jgi:F0F1-type ATP synthase membrane subunit b/b'